jgi:hypothetical protein
LGLALTLRFGCEQSGPVYLDPLPGLFLTLRRGRPQCYLDSTSARRRGDNGPNRAAAQSGCLAAPTPAVQALHVRSCTGLGLTGLTALRSRQFTSTTGRRLRLHRNPPIPLSREDTHAHTHTPSVSPACPPHTIPYPTIPYHTIPYSWCFCRRGWGFSGSKKSH